jgi:ferredoxin-NADP reductase
VPLMAILRHRAIAGSSVATRLLYSSRSLEDVIYRDELDHLMESSPMLEVEQTLSRAQPPGWTSYARRIDTQMLREVVWPVKQRPLTFTAAPHLSWKRPRPVWWNWDMQQHIPGRNALDRHEKHDGKYTGWQCRRRHATRDLSL